MRSNSRSRSRSPDRHSRRRRTRSRSRSNTKRRSRNRSRSRSNSRTRVKSYDYNRRETRKHLEHENHRRSRTKDQKDRNRRRSHSAENSSPSPCNKEDKKDQDRWPNDKYFDLNSGKRFNNSSNPVDNNLGGSTSGIQQERRKFGYHDIKKSQEENFMDARRLQREAFGDEGISYIWGRSPLKPEE